MPLPDLSTHPRPRAASVWEMALLVACAALVVVAARSAWRTVEERDRAEARVAFVRSEGARLRAEAREVARHRGRVREDLVAPLLLSIDAPPARVAAAIATRLPPSARVGNLVLRYADSLWVDVEIDARDAAAYDRLVEGLLAASEFRDLLPGPEVREGEIRSSLSARFVPEAP